MTTEARRQKLSRRAATGVIAACITQAWAQPAPQVEPRQAAKSGYPRRPIKLIVPFAPGGSTDIVARLVADAMQAGLGQPVVVDNRAGAAGLVGTEQLARSLPDGYTIGIGTISTLAVNTVVLKAARHDPLQELAPITTLAQIPSVFSTHPGMGVQDFRGFVAAVRAQPDHYTIGSAGVGSIGHLIAESMNETLGIRMRHIPYKGQGPVINSALAGETQILSDQYPSSQGLVQSGRMVPFAVAASQRLPALPEVPTLAELGYPRLNQLAITWFGLVAPAKTPRAILDALGQAARQALQSPELKDRLQQLGVQPMAGSPAEFARLIGETRQQVQAIVAAQRIPLD